MVNHQSLQRDLELIKQHLGVTEESKMAQTLVDVGGILH